MPNFAAQAAIKCGEERFQDFLFDATGVSRETVDFPAVALREICKIKSRKELNTDPEAQKRWKLVQRWFQQWRRGAGKNELGFKNPPFKMGNAAFRRGADVDENPFDPRAEYEVYPGDYECWKSGWNSEKNMQKNSTS